MAGHATDERRFLKTREPARRRESMGTPSKRVFPCSDATVVALLALACAAWPTVGRAEEPDAGAPRDAYGSDADPPLLECPADKIRARRSASAEVERFRRLFVSVTAETVGQAELQAAAWFAADEAARVAPAVERARDALTAQVEAARVGGTPEPKVAGGAGRLSGPLCAALAARDLAACAALGPEERGACEAWVGVWRATREGGAGGCTTLGAAGAPLCQAVMALDPAPCAAGRGEGRARCEAAVRSIVDGVARCGADFDASRCGFGLLGRGLSAGRAACEAVAPSPERSTAAHAQTHQLCQAVLGGEPHRCPNQASSSRAGVPVVSEVMLLGSLRGPRAAVVLAASAPSLCHLDIAVSGGVVPRRFVSVVRQPSWAPRVWRLPLSHAVDPFTHTAALTATCAPVASW
jgi:hypothetical protein